MLASANLRFLKLDANVGIPILPKNTIFTTLMITLSDFESRI